MKLTDFQKIHFIGIGGIGMSALARLCIAERKTVSGSDRSPSTITDSLVGLGVKIFSSQSTENIEDDLDLVIYTEAINEKTEGFAELNEARKRGIKTLNYFDALGLVANEYYLIAVAGSHGKTTTTAMLIDIFEAAELDPSAVVGSLRAKTKSNYRAGKSKYFIVEACEYKRDFLSLKPDILVITNLEHEHVDYYKDLTAVQDAFKEFVDQVRPGGFVVANLADENVRPVLAKLIQSNEVTNEGSSFAKEDPSLVQVIDYGKFFNPLRKLIMPGMHNQQNAAAAVAAAAQVGITTEVADKALAEFAGTWRRFEYKGEVNGAKVYDDYGHHPTEITATIRGTRELYPKQKLTLVFQSHTYSRTVELFADFVTALALADKVIILPIYAAREENVSGVSHTKLAEAVNAKGGVAIALETFAEAVSEVKSSVTADDIVVVMGAGDVTKIASDLIENNKDRHESYN